MDEQSSAKIFCVLAVLFVAANSTEFSSLFSLEQEINVKIKHDIINNFNFFIGFIGILGLLVLTQIYIITR
ncbi:hypothetical protein AAFH68_00490 [Flavobacterium sp. CGRL1]